MGYVLGLIVAVLAFAAFIVARDAMYKARLTEQRLDQLAAQLVKLAGIVENLRVHGAAALGAGEEISEGEVLLAGPEFAQSPIASDRPRSIAATASVGLPAPLSAAAAVDAASTAAAAPGSQSPPSTSPSTAGMEPPKKRTSLEERLGAGLTVWVGAIAIALAGALLVKYSFDQGWVGPGVRVTMGALLGVVALGIGEWLRTRAAAISAGLSAAGIAVLYASVLASGELYGFISPLTAFALMALVTATAVVLALRQGPIIAAIGLIGGFATPLLIETGDASAMRLFPYLLLVELGLLVVSDRRGWWGISLAALGASLAWVLLWLESESDSSDGAILLSFLILSGAAFLVASARSTTSGRQPPVWLPWAAAGGVLLVSGTALSAGGYRTLDWALFGLIGAGTLAAGRLRQEWERMPWLSAGLSAVLLLGSYEWMGAGPLLSPFGGPYVGSVPFLDPADYRSRLLITVALGALYAIGGYVALWGSRRPWLWAALSGASTVVYFLVAYVPRFSEPSILRWGAWALVLAAVGIGAAWPIARRRKQLEQGSETLAALAASITTLIALAIPIELSREWISVTWAIQAAAVVWIAHRLEVPHMRRLAWPLAALVGVRLLFSPFILSYPIGQLPILNWFLYGYGIPIIAFTAAAWRAEGDGDFRLADALRWLTAALGLWLISLQVHHLFSPNDLERGIRTFAEGSTYPWVWLAYALGLWRAARRWPSEALERAGLIVAGLGLAAFILGPLLILNPIFGDGPLGDPLRVGATPLFNWLVPAYGFPAALFAALGFEAQRRADVRFMRAALATAAMVASFALVSFEIRQFYQGSILALAGSTTTFAERSTYSIAWILFSAALLGLGINRGWRSARYGALVVMLIAVIKVFLIDIGTLGGLYRVGSFLGLGASLLGIAWLYTRFVVGRSES